MRVPGILGPALLDDNRRLPVQQCLRLGRLEADPPDRQRQQRPDRGSGHPRQLVRDPGKSDPCNLGAAQRGKVTGGSAVPKGKRAEGENGMVE